MAQLGMCKLCTLPNQIQFSAGSKFSRTGYEMIQVYDLGFGPSSVFDLLCS